MSNIEDNAYLSDDDDEINQKSYYFQNFQSFVLNQLKNNDQKVYETCLNGITSEQLQLHNIEIIRENSQLSKVRSEICIFSIVQTLSHGLQYRYHITIGPFKLNIYILNLNRNSDDCDQQIQEQQIGVGNFGNVRAVKIGNKQFAVKRIYFLSKLQRKDIYDYNLQKLHQTYLKSCLKQFCIYKICSLLGIGPRIIKNKYDIICFNNCMQFSMELCQTLQDSKIIHKDTFSIEKLKFQLKNKLKKLHAFRIVHRDIKPQNILYSNQKEEFIFGDFGLAQFIKETYNQSTLTMFAGTLNYCSPQMEILLDGKAGYVNLYVNDYCSLQKTFQNTSKLIIKENSHLTENPMSNDDEYSLQDVSFALIEERSSQIRQQPTGISYASGTGRTLLTLSTNYIIPLTKYSTSVNYIQSQILYQLCRCMQNNTQISQYIMDKTAMTSRQEYQLSDDLYSIIKNQLKMIFNGGKDNKLLKISQWRHACRHYGQTHPYSLELLTNFKELFEQQNELELIKRMIQNRQLQLKPKFQEMKLLRSQGNYNQYAYLLLSYMKHQLSHPLTKLQFENQDSYCKFISQEILFLSTQMASISQHHQKLLYKLFNQTLAKYAKPNIVQKINKQQNYSHINQMPWHCFRYLKQIQSLKNIHKAHFLMVQSSKKNITDKIWKTIIQICKDEILQLKHQPNQLSLQFITIVHKLNNINNIQFEQIWKDIHQILNQSSKYQTTTHQIHFSLMQIQSLMAKQQNQKALEMINKMDEQIKEHIVAKNIQINYILCYYSIKSLVLIKSQKYDQALQLLETCYRTYIRNLGNMNRNKFALSILLNIPYVYCRKHQYENARLGFEKVIFFLQGKPNRFLIHKKMYAYNMLIYLECLIIEQNNSDYSQNSTKLSLYVTKFIQCLCEYSSSQLCEALQNNKIKILSIDHLNVRPCDRIQVYKYFILSLKHRLKNKMHLFNQFFKYSAFIANYLIKQKGQVDEGLHYLNNYLKLSQELHLFDQNFYKSINLVCQYLAIQNSKKAYFLLKKYIFRIPISFIETKKNAFMLMQAISKVLGKATLPLYKSLTQKKCRLLQKQNYQTVIQQFDSIKDRMLVEKWIKRL